MGTYHSTGLQWEATGNRNGSRTLTREGVRTVFDFCLAHPEIGIVAIGKQFGMSGSTALTWLAAPAHLKLNQYLVEWFQEHDHLARWLQTRPRNRVGDRLMQAIGTEASILDVHQFPTWPEPTTGFVPVTNDDLLVIREDALRLKAEAESVVTEASTLVVAIDTIRDWLGNRDKLEQALGRVQSLEAQLKAADDIVKRFQQQKLATDQVHSRD